jgi:ribonuclease E
MGKIMLIDASHPEESRVAILDNNRLEEFDFETTTKKQLKGNIYLAKVIRIEPSLQAAFVEFGGNRHGFLAFNEIHPDYYRIPVEDREALMQQHEEEMDTGEETTEDTKENEGVETLGGEDVEEIEARPLRRSLPSKKYKIQEVLTRGQVMLVQVVKEERGGKGAALTTYLSLAGRYCVLMPNAAKGGGVSRKITNATDRKRLRDIIQSIELPSAMALIVRTAGMARTKVEIKRDCDYLMRLWNDIRDKTLHSIAPCLIYEESPLIKRSIRDYYTRDIEEIWIEGEEGYKEAKEFIRKLMPSHLKKIHQYKDEKIPLFYRYGAERQIDAMHNPIIQLRSGGYIVFGTTEALVAIDVNSGRATRERHIEETAFKTNLEAAEEVARQLRLRDLAGLVVIDFIDMEDNRNIEAVERRLKDSMRHDRARVQVGRISPFGLLELSRQRLRPNIIESTSLPCKACRGSGMIRSVESAALHVLRAIEEEALQQKVTEFNVYVPTAIALYILNQKRSALHNIETRWSVSVKLYHDDEILTPDYRIERPRLQKQPIAPQSRSELPENASEEKRTPSGESGRRPHPRHGPRRPMGRKGESHPQQQSQSLKVETTEQPRSTETPSEDQQTSSESKPTRNKPRRRFRKFDRRAPSQPREGDGNVVSSAPIEKPTSNENERPAVSAEKPAAAEVTSPKKVEKKKAEEKPSSSGGKKGSSRKGWWKRLIE